jgi:hypothetical protein
LEKRNVEFAPPRFHPPPAAVDEDTDLITGLGSFSLGPSDSEKAVLQKKEEQRYEEAWRRKTRYSLTAGAIMVMFFVWNYLFTDDVAAQNPPPIYSELDTEILAQLGEDPVQIEGESSVGQQTAAILVILFLSACTGLHLMADKLLKKGIVDRIITYGAAAQVLATAFIASKIWVGAGEWAVWQAAGSLVFWLGLVLYLWAASGEDTVQRVIQ